MARKMRYVAHCLISYLPFDAMTAAACMNCAEATVSRQTQGVRMIVLTAKESFRRHQCEPARDVGPADPKTLNQLLASLRIVC